MADDDDLEEEFEEEFDDYDDDDEDDEGAISGLVVLLMGVVMLGAFASVVWIAYQQGIKNSNSETPYVAADPEPVKIETAEDVASAGNDREVYDNLEGRDADPVEIIAAGPEEPVDRSVDDTIGAIASSVGGTVDDAIDDAGAITDDAVADRIAQLEQADQALQDLADDAGSAADAMVDDAATAVTNASDAAAETLASVTSTDDDAITVPDPPSLGGGGALSGSHLVQVGAFRSEAEADTFWGSMESKMGDYLSGKSKDVEFADLGDRGVFYRLRVGPFASSDAARTYCAGLKERGQDCLIKAK